MGNNKEGKREHPISPTVPGVEMLTAGVEFTGVRVPRTVVKEVAE